MVSRKRIKTLQHGGKIVRTAENYQVSLGPTPGADDHIHDVVMVGIRYGNSGAAIVARESLKGF